MNTKIWAMLCIASAVVGGFSRASRADSVTATLVTVVPLFGTNMSLDGNTISNTYIGEIVWNGAGQGNTGQYNGTFYTFCMDLTDAIGVGDTFIFTTQSDIANAPKPSSGGPMGAAKAAEIEELFGQHYSSLSTDDEIQAFQLAIWNIIYDTDTSVEDGAGNFYVIGASENSAANTAGGDVLDSNTITLADEWLAEAADPSNQDLDNDNLQALTGQIGIQDQITVGNPVPLPSSAMCGVVLLACCGVAKRMSRPATAAVRATR